MKSIFFNMNGGGGFGELLQPETRPCCPLQRRVIFSFPAISFSLCSVIHPVPIVFLYGYSSDATPIKDITTKRKLLFDFYHILNYSPNPFWP